ncbi:GDSL-type esterase/lipase family protein [Nocardia cerradoensis]|uniref:Lipase 2 n=1 Tax=Nocardia cerradoensis TaxID=85688 RepID=A0A231GST1_9NOCA|nr:GDSL-type esterase/lipase family protein [Nocardia cerradoensis]NKY41857.1 SGNH/GDSL hydrolase family protein [Nocardia cerradoensis]OXR39676.1 Lipase 2 [Nocardia cerradoensis]
MRNDAVRRLQFLVSAAMFAATPATVSAAPPADPSHRAGAEFVAIGDSYIATGAYPATLLQPGPCIQSSDSVAHLIAAQMPQVSFADWSCGGAVTDDMTQIGAMGPQVDGLSTATEYVALSIGGNNGNIFGGTIADCFVGAMCTQAKRAAVAAGLDALPTQLDTAYAAIRRHAPNAKIVVLGYPRILPDDPAGCFVDAITGRDAVAFANTTQATLNSDIAAAADRVGFTYVDPSAPGDHSICARDGQRFVSFTGLENGDDGSAFHPTEAGRRYMAARAFAALTAP